MAVRVFIDFEREREEEEEEEKQRERENPKQSSCCPCRAPHGARSHEFRDHDLNRNQELDA